ncbi:PREDICTED: BTB and MATH domain-containing protein 38-like [Acropora digitifera]|uniref:BTB and MATH domain-containing protein 38-like n=1 Tax=Acropora digitifera TaxID=70779 RepID=UPI00077B007F|nr:PREDICTED: BTB and MATH domain-containing protein 38-like [Acropora digitifera]
MLFSEEEAAAASREDLPDFSEPWLLSDVVLVVEEEKIHVHRSMLAVWSPVFAKMFTAQFKEQTADEIPLPEKKASEIKEMLQVIYPTIGKEVHEGNYLSLLNLAKEYMMTKLTKKCEIFLVGKLQNSHCLEYLDVAQAYELKELEEACIKKAKRESFDVLKRHRVYEEINYSNYRALAEAKLTKMENTLAKMKKENERLSDQVESLKDEGEKALEHLEYLISNITINMGYTNISETIEKKLYRIRTAFDQEKKSCTARWVICGHHSNDSNK